MLSIRVASLKHDKRVVQFAVLNENEVPELAIHLRGKETREMACN